MTVIKLDQTSVNPLKYGGIRWLHF